MNTDQSSVRLLGPVDQMPAEGFDSGADTGKSLLDFYVSALAESEIGFDVSEDGIRPMRPAARGGVFQRFDLSNNSESGEAVLEPAEDAYEINFDALLAGRGGWDDLNDASEPADFVRRFLEIVGPALDGESEIEFEGRHVPLIRWVPKDDEAGARIQLLGVLQADEEQFDAFCRANADDFNLIHEDDDVEARGIRELAVALAVLGVSAMATPEAEAGFFEKLFKKNDDGQMKQVNERRAVKRTQAKVVRSAEGWVDASNNARIDHAFLAAAAKSGAERRVVVDIEKQRAYLVIDGRIAIDTPVSTARGEKHTPRGEFKITERIRTGKTSNLYGCSLPYWMRLDSSAIGMHIGDLPGYPASAGCIRLPFSVAPYMFDGTSSGTTVQVVDSWSGPQAQTPIMVAQAN